MTALHRLNKGFFVLAGPVGSGKSTEAQYAFGRGAITISSDPNVLRYPRQRFVNGKSKVFSDREMLVTPYGVDVVNQSGEVLSSTREMDGDHPKQFDYIESFEAAAYKVLNKIAAEAMAKKPLTYRNLIIDEAGTMLTWAFASIRDGGAGKTKANNVDMRRVYTLTHDWMVRVLVDLMQIRQYGANLVWITHEQEPEDKKRGGAAFLSQQIAKTVSKMADGILLRRLERVKSKTDGDGLLEKTQVIRTWSVFADPDWDTKLRGLDEEDFEVIRTLPLAEIIPRAGFEV